MGATMLDNLPRGTICIEDIEMGMSRYLRKEVTANVDTIDSKVCGHSVGNSTRHIVGRFENTQGIEIVLAVVVHCREYYLLRSRETTELSFWTVFDLFSAVDKVDFRETIDREWTTPAG